MPTTKPAARPQTPARCRLLQLVITTYVLLALFASGSICVSWIATYPQRTEAAEVCLHVWQDRNKAECYVTCVQLRRGNLMRATSAR